MKSRRSRPAILPTILVVATLAVAGACGGSAPAAPSCSNLGLNACPSPAPAYAADVAPLIQAHCVVCHEPGGMEAATLLQTYDEVVHNTMGIQSEVSNCMMPPATQPPLTDAERMTILAWIGYCMAPND